MKAFLQMIIARMKEPSSWAGIGVMLAGAGLNVEGDLMQAVSFTGMGVAGLLAFFLKEKPQA